MEGASVYKGSDRKPRTDAIRNRERVLEAAKAVFSQGGPEASLEAVAREAGVGIGTLYRHFPTREALYDAVYRREVDQLVELARHLATTTTPIQIAYTAGSGNPQSGGEVYGYLSRLGDSTIQCAEP